MSGRLPSRCIVLGHLVGGKEVGTSEPCSCHYFLLDFDVYKMGTISYIHRLGGILLTVFLSISLYLNRVDFVQDQKYC